MITSDKGFREFQIVAAPSQRHTEEYKGRSSGKGHRASDAEEPGCWLESQEGVEPHGYLCTSLLASKMLRCPVCGTLLHPPQKVNTYFGRSMQKSGASAPLRRWQKVEAAVFILFVGMVTGVVTEKPKLKSALTQARQSWWSSQSW